MADNFQPDETNGRVWGFYWVMEEDEWIIAHWVDGVWFVAGLQFKVYDDYWQQIDEERIIKKSLFLIYNFTNGKFYVDCIMPEGNKHIVQQKIFLRQIQKKLKHSIPRKRLPILFISTICLENVFLYLKIQSTLKHLKKNIQQ